MYLLTIIVKIVFGYPYIFWIFVNLEEVELSLLGFSKEESPNKSIFDYSLRLAKI